MGDGSHYQCGGILRPIEEVAAFAAEKILAGLENVRQAKDARLALEARYPFPQESSDRWYVCAVCKKKYRLEWHQGAPRRLCCSMVCELSWIGQVKPKGREWVGFLTLYPHFKGSKVRYLGTVHCFGKEAECYLWGVGAGGGSLYAYWGDGKGDHAAIQFTFGCQHYDTWGPLFKLAESGKGVDESWRVAANGLDRWTLPEYAGAHKTAEAPPAPNGGKTT